VLVFPLSFVMMSYWAGTWCSGSTSGSLLILQALIDVIGNDH